MKLDINKLLLAQARTGKTWEQLGIDRNQIKRIRQGCSVRGTTIYKIATALGVDPAELIANEEVTL